MKKTTANKFKELQDYYIANAQSKQKKQIKEKDNEKQFTTNTFYHYAEEYRKHATDETEIEKIDMTEIFWAELFEIMKNNELINININAPPASGKSVTGMAIAQLLCRSYFKREFGLCDIDRDQQEFSMTMRDPNINNTIRVIDEWNELETTGENSSTEEALLNYFSDVMAQRWIHKISCSPTSTADRNALIYLEVFATDKINKVNHCKIFYRLFSGGIDFKQLIGYVNIYVNDVLEEQWYKQYRKRKFEKMELILKKGIFRPRVLEYADVILTVVEKLKLLTNLTGRVDPNIIRNYIKIQCREKKIPQSIIGEELSVREVSGILSLYQGYFKVCRDIVKLEGRNCDFEKLKEFEKMKNALGEAINIQNNELKEYKEINKEYNKKLK